MTKSAGTHKKMNFDVVPITNPNQLQQLYTKPDNILQSIREKYGKNAQEAGKDGKAPLPYLATDLAYDDALRTLTRLYRQQFIALGSIRVMLLIFDNPEEGQGLDCELYVRTLDDEWKYRPCPISRVGNTLDVGIMQECEWSELMKTEAHRCRVAMTPNVKQ